MGQENSENLLGMLNPHSILLLIDQKILEPFNVLGTMMHSKYRTKIVRDQSNNEVMRVDYDPYAGS